MPTAIPSHQPSFNPTSIPSYMPSTDPSHRPSYNPSTMPSHFPSTIPSSMPTKNPTTIPSHIPSTIPSKMPTHNPTTIPSHLPSTIPSRMPSHNPSSTPTHFPSTIPSKMPSHNPSTIPSRMPSNEPSSRPSYFPSTDPTRMPSVSPLTSEEEEYQIITSADVEETDFEALSVQDEKYFRGGYRNQFYHEVEVVLNSSAQIELFRLFTGEISYNNDSANEYNIGWVNVTSEWIIYDVTNNDSIVSIDSDIEIKYDEDNLYLNDDKTYGIYTFESNYIINNDATTNIYSPSICSRYDDEYFTPHHRYKFQNNIVFEWYFNDDISEVYTAKESKSKTLIADSPPTNGSCIIDPESQKGTVLEDEFNISCSGWENVAYYNVLLDKSIFLDHEYETLSDDDDEGSFYFNSGFLPSGDHRLQIIMLNSRSTAICEEFNVTLDTNLTQFGYNFGNFTDWLHDTIFGNGSDANASLTTQSLEVGIAYDLILAYANETEVNGSLIVSEQEGLIGRMIDSSSAKINGSTGDDVTQSELTSYLSVLSDVTSPYSSNDTSYTASVVGNVLDSTTDVVDSLLDTLNTSESLDTDNAQTVFGMSNILLFSGVLFFVFLAFLRNIKQQQQQQ